MTRKEFRAHEREQKRRLHRWPWHRVLKAIGLGLVALFLAYGLVLKLLGLS